MELTRGCMANSLTVDGTEEIYLSEDKRLEVKKQIGKWILKSDISLNNLLVLLLEHFHDEYDCSDEPCECCGDFIETYKLDI